MSDTPHFAYVGCRTTRERNAHGDGIVVYALDSDAKQWRQTQLVEGLLNPSYLAFDQTGRTLVAVHGDSSEISSFRIDPKDGRLSLVNQAPTNGKNPVHLAIDPTNRFVVVANHVTSDQYVSGLAVLALESDGALGELVDHVPLTGNIGPHRIEQPFAKPHQCQFDPAGRFIAVPDKGLDVVFTYRLDASGKLHGIDGAPAQTREGEGPRHIAFHPQLPYAFVINELSSTVMSCRYDAETGALKPIQVLSSLPDTFIGFSRASEIEVSADGRFVYASNRGHNSIAAFAVETETGRLTSTGWTLTQGKTPRFFALAHSGKSLFVANEDSDTIIRFDRDAQSGELTSAALVARTGSPTCVVFSGSKRRDGPEGGLCPSRFE